MPSLRFPLAVFAALALSLPAGAVSDHLPADELATAQSILSRVRDVVRANYYPREKIDAHFESACDAARAAIDHAADLNEAYAAIADAVMSVDSRIRFYPPLRSARADYGWRWHVIGDAAYVTEIDQVGDAVAKGLKLGDKILSIDGLQLNRGNYQQLYYLFNTLSPRPGLNVLAQSPGQEPRLLAIATTLRPQRRTRTIGPPTNPRTEWILTDTEKRHRDERKSVHSHFRRIGDVAVWKTLDLERQIPDVAEGLKEAADARALILDFRGLFPLRYETALRLLDGIFEISFDAGTMEREGSKLALRVHGGADSFHGTVIILMDSRTAGYAEFVARVVQQRQRAVLVGDRTMGRVFEERAFPYFGGTAHSYSVSAVVLPRGEIALSDGSSIDGRGVAPDLLLLPAPADLAGRRDPVLAKALAMLKQPVTAEDAFKMFWVERDDDEETDD